MKKLDRKLMYFLGCCILFALLVIGATYAYFTAKASDDNTVKGDAATVSFGLSVDKITTVDMAYGMVPMRNNQAPKAASNKCHDDNNNAGCQLYKITVHSDSDTVMFLDGYVFMTPKDERLETRIANVYTDDKEDYYTKFTADDFKRDDFDESSFIKTGVRVTDSNTSPKRTEDYNSLIVSNEKIGGDVGRTKDFYIMVWVYDNGEAQDYLQGMQLAYQGSVTFITAEGNEISATFD